MCRRPTLPLIGLNTVFSPVEQVNRPLFGKSMMRTFSRVLKTAAIVFGLSSAPSWSASVTISVDGADYSLTTLVGSYLDNVDLLGSQVWWYNEDLAEDLALVLEYDLGSPNGVSGPYFAIRPVYLDTIVPTDEPLLGGVRSARYNFLAGSVSGTVAADDPDFTWAIAAPVSAVPIPAGGVLLISGIAGLAAIRRRKMQASSR